MRFTMANDREASYRATHIGKGAEYAEAFTCIPHRALLWKLERRVLDRIVRESFADGAARYLDFACGTGRILGYLQPRVACAVGVDISPSMLEVARASVPGATLIEADITRDDALGALQFDLVTAFRFFPNAEPELRAAVMQKLVLHLAPGGLLVFNNHKNDGSLAQRIAQWRKPDIADPGMMCAHEVRRLVHDAGLVVVKAHPLGVLPLTENHMARPYWVMGGLESLASHVPGVLPLAQDVIYVCRRRASSARSSCVT
jgi:SAM-dependent methyltransferase